MNDRLDQKNEEPIKSKNNNNNNKPKNPPKSPITI